MFFFLNSDVTQEVTFCLNVIRYLKYPIFEQKTLCALRFLMLALGKVHRVLRTAKL